LVSAEPSGKSSVGTVMLPPVDAHDERRCIGLVLDVDLGEPDAFALHLALEAPGNSRTTSS
jgi:hypothetical protein